jgi:tetratricopeptide (TPR) repeat protein
VKLSRPGLRIVAGSMRWGSAGGPRLFAFSTFVIVFAALQRLPLSASPQATSPLHERTGSAPKLLAIPQPTPSTDPAVKEQIEDAWSQFLGVSQREGASQQELANAYGQMGMVYHAYGFVDAAAACYQNANSLAPREFRWPYYLGRLHQDEGDNKQAITNLKIAEGLRPDDVAALVNLGEVYQADGQAVPAEALFKRALAVDPSQAAALAGLGEIALSQGDYALAIRSLEAALQLQPGATTLHYPLAMAYRKTGDVQDALAHLEKKGSGTATLPDPLMDKVGALKRGQRALWVEGNKALAEGRYADAVKAYKQMVATADEADPVPRIHLGVALAQSGDLSGAVDQYQQVLRFAPGSAVAHYNLGVLALELKSEDEARKEFSAALALDPGFKLAHFQLANLLMRDGRFTEASSHYTRAMELGLDNEFVRLMKAMAWVRIRKYGEAEAELNEDVAALPESSDLRLALARLLAACPDKSLRDGPRAVRLVDQLLKSNTSPDLELLETYGMAIASVGRFREAADLQRRMIDELAKMRRNDLIADLQINLGLYEHGQVCPLPWRDDDPIFSPQPGKMVLFVPSKEDPSGEVRSSSH